MLDFVWYIIDKKDPSELGARYNIFYWLLLQVIFGLIMSTYSDLTYNKTYIYPDWAIGVGWVMACSSIVMVPIVMIARICMAKGTFKEVCSSDLFFISRNLSHLVTGQRNEKVSLYTLWLTESSAYQTWQSIMVSHTAVDTIIDCQDLYAELRINHRVTGRTLPTELVKWQRTGWYNSHDQVKLGKWLSAWWYNLHDHLTKQIGQATKCNQAEGTLIIFYGQPIPTVVILTCRRK